MADLQSVRPPPTFLGGHGKPILAVVLVGLVAAILKPWGPGPEASRAEATPSAAPRPMVTPAPASKNGFADLAYDPSIFGDHEPSAAWALWPTGYLVTFGYVAQITDASAPLGDPGPISSPGSAKPSGPAGRSGSFAPAATDDRGPTWPASFAVPDGVHLLVVGVDMPSGFTIDSATVERLGSNGHAIEVPLTRLTSPWPTHFAVIGLPPGAGDRQLRVWPPGDYRLSLTFDPGRVRRSVDMVVGTASAAP